MALQVIEGTWEEIKSHERELVGHRFRLIPLVEAVSTASQLPASIDSDRLTRIKSISGKYAGVVSSEEFMRRKQGETDREDRPHH
jgi:hypothetical protein